jgi:hypothetical protein
MASVTFSTINHIAAATIVRLADPTQSRREMRSIFEKLGLKRIALAKDLQLPSFRADGVGT